MTSLTIAQAALLTQDELIQGVVDEIVTVDLFAQTLPFEGTNAKVIVITRELTETGATYQAVNTTVNADPATVTRVTFGLGRIMGEAEVDEFELLQMSDPNDQMATQVSRQAKTIARRWGNGIITGTGSFPQFSGISTMITQGTQVVQASSTTSGAALSFDLMDELLDTTTAKNGENDFIIMNAFQRRAFRSLLRTQGLNEQQVELGFINPLTGETGKNLVMAYDSVPIFKNANLTNESTNGSSGKGRIFAGVYGRGEGGLYGLMPSDSDPGIRVSVEFIKDIKPANARRVQMITGLALESTIGLSKLGNLTGS